jgi:hypothetical protein
LVFGLYFLLNVLLAVVFDNYKKKLEERVSQKQEMRSEYISHFFFKYDKGLKGFLDVEESKPFLQIIMNLDFSKKGDR